MAFPAITAGATLLAVHAWLCEALQRVEEEGTSCLLQNVVLLLKQPLLRCVWGPAVLHQSAAGPTILRVLAASAMLQRIGRPAGVRLVHCSAGGVRCCLPAQTVLLKVSALQGNIEHKLPARQPLRVGRVLQRLSSKPHRQWRCAATRPLCSAAASCCTSTMRGVPAFRLCGRHASDDTAASAAICNQDCIGSLTGDQSGPACSHDVSGCLQVLKAFTPPAQKARRPPSPQCSRLSSSG